MSDIFFRAEHLKMQFYAGNKQKQVVLDDASFTVEQGEAVGIVGPSGAGKSTIARIICGLIRPERGDIYFKGTHIVGAEKTFQKEFRTRIQLIPQQPYLSLDPKQKLETALWNLYLFINWSNRKNRLKHALTNYCILSD